MKVQGVCNENFKILQGDISIGYHNRISSDLLEDHLRDKKEVLKVQCKECYGFPVNPAQCRCCESVFCAEFFLPELNFRGKCPACGAENHTAQSNPESPTQDDDDDLKVLNLKGEVSEELRGTL